MGQNRKQFSVMQLNASKTDEFIIFNLTELKTRLKFQESYFIGR